MMQYIDPLTIGRWGGGLLIILLGLVLPDVLEAAALPLALLLIVCIGIPHGAIDQLLFRQMSRMAGKSGGIRFFYSVYLGLILVYVLLWLVFPWLGFILFIGLSIYHFGQSDWSSALSSRTSNWVYFSCWGSFVLLTPILWHYESSKPIIEAIVGAELPVLLPFMYIWATVALVFLNFCLLCWSAVIGRISVNTLRLGLAQLFFLFLLFTTVPLLLGFALYFSGWHALSSIQDQISFLKIHRREYSWKHYVRDAAGFSMLALIGLGGVIWGFKSGGLTDALGLLFMGIAAITLPHMILMDRLYSNHNRIIYGNN